MSDYAALTGRDHVSGAEILDSDEDGQREQEDGWETDSDQEEEDDSDGEWIDVHHSSDEEVQVKRLTMF